MSSDILTTLPALSRADALFLDFDGTLAPIQNDPDAVHLKLDQMEQLTALATTLGGALAILSGRDLSDLSKRVPGTLWRFGNHGLYRAAPGEAASAIAAAAPEALLAGIQDLADQHPGVRVEPKGPVIAIHYRAAPNVEGALGDALAGLLADFSGYKLQHGKCVFEAKPFSANKGEALRAAMLLPEFRDRRPVMIGDDTTDEDAFEIAESLGGIAIKVGDGPTLARHRLPDVDAVHLYLRQDL